MSIIRKRQRKLIGIGLIGFSIGILIMVLGGTYVIRYKQDWVTRVQEGADVKPKEEAIVKEDVYTVIEPVAKGERVTKEKLMRMEIETRYVPTNSVKESGLIEGRRAKMDLEPRMLLTTSMVENDEVPYLEEGLERIEISALHTPRLFEVGDRVNIRIQFPTGQDYRLIVDKPLVDVDIEAEIFYVDLNEEEILNLSSALVDETIYPGTRVYLTRYFPPDGEDDAESIYPMNPNVEEMGIAMSNPHSVEERVILDASLLEYYDDDAIIYRYNQLELNEQDLAKRAQEYKKEREQRRAVALEAATAKESSAQSDEQVVSGSQEIEEEGSPTSQEEKLSESTDPQASDAKTNEAKASDTKVNDAKINDTKVNETKTNDTKVNETKTNDTKVSEAKATNSVSNSEKPQSENQSDMGF